MAQESLWVLVNGVRFSVAVVLLGSNVLLHIAAGANLMGSDLYNNLIRYFINHLKTLRDVRTINTIP